MIILNQNEARKLPVLLIDKENHLLPKTGVAEGDVTVKITKDLGTLTDFTLAGKWAEIGHGVYSISFSASDLDTIGFFAYVVTAVGCDQYSGMVYVDAPREGTTPAQIWSHPDRKLTSRDIESETLGEYLPSEAQLQTHDQQIKELVKGEPKPKASFNV